MEKAHVYPIFVGDKKEMATKETVALIGIANQSCEALIKKLAQHYRLLLIQTQGNNLIGLSHQIMNSIPSTAIEVMECAKDGCWEADIILLIEMDNFEEGFIKRIKEVATQKIVVSISADKSGFSFSGENSLSFLLPYSKVVQILKKPGVKDVFLSGNDQEAVQTIYDKAKVFGYHITIVDDLSERAEMLL